MSTFKILGNGVRLFVDPMQGLRSAAVGVWARAGAVDEAREENGVAHLLEHMAFKGTLRRSARQIAEEIEAVGGYLNAETGYQRTGYFARVLKDDVPLSLDILGDIFLNPVIDNTELDKEKEVVVQEIGEAWDAPDDAVNDLLQRVAYGDHALGRPILGEISGVRGHSTERLHGFRKRCYRAENLVVAAAGAVDARAIEDLVTEHFSGAWRGGGEVERIAPAYAGGVASDRRDIEQTHVAIAFPGVGATHADYYAMRVFSELLGGGMSSRLFQTIREDRGLAYSVYSYAEAFDTIGVLGCYVGADDRAAGEAARLVRREIRAVAERVSDAELRRAKALIRSSALMGLENPAGRIDAAAANIFTFGRPVTADEVCAAIEQVSAGDVQRCARRALEDGPFSLAVVGAGDAKEVEQALAS